MLKRDIFELGRLYGDMKKEIKLMQKGKKFDYDRLINDANKCLAIARRSEDLPQRGVIIKELLEVKEVATNAHYQRGTQ